MSRINTIQLPEPRLLQRVGDREVRAKMTVGGGLSLVSACVADGGAATVIDLGTAAVGRLVALLRDAGAIGISRDARPCGLQSDVHEALLAASGQSNQAGERRDV